MFEVPLSSLLRQFLLKTVLDPGVGSKIKCTITTLEKLQIYSDDSAATENPVVNESDRLIASKAEVAKLNLQIREQVCNFEAILSSISDFAYVFNEHGRFVFINQSLLDSLGL
jgi:PAS domain-containing protein